MADRLENRTAHKASEMWVGMRTTCGNISVVVGIVVGGKTHVFLATPEVIGKLADQIAVVLEEPILRPHAPQPRFLLRNGADRKLVAGVTR